MFIRNFSIVNVRHSRAFYNAENCGAYNFFFNFQYSNSKQISNEPCPLQQSFCRYMYFRSFDHSERYLIMDKLPRRLSFDVFAPVPSSCYMLHAFHWSETRANVSRCQLKKIPIRGKGETFNLSFVYSGHCSFCSFRMYVCALR